MEKILIIEDREFINELERLQYEVDSRKSILSYMISSDMNINSDGFNIYQNDYLNSYKAYNNKKRDVEIKFIKPIIKNPKSWRLDFVTGELIIEC